MSLKKNFAMEDFICSLSGWMCFVFLDIGLLLSIYYEYNTGYTGLILFFTIPLNFLFLYLTLSTLAIYNIEKLKEPEQNKKIEEDFRKSANELIDLLYEINKIEKNEELLK